MKNGVGFRRNRNASFVLLGVELPPLTDFSFRLVAFLSLPPCPLLVGFLPAVCRKPFRFLRREVCPGLFNRHKLLYGFLLGRLLPLAFFLFESAAAITDAPGTAQALFHSGLRYKLLSIQQVFDKLKRF